MEPIRFAALAAAFIICSQSGVAAQAPAPAERKAPAQTQTERNSAAAGERKPQAQRKQTAQPKQPEPSGRSVCVASAIGHTFHVQKIGVMVFGNALDKIPIDSWGIDDAAVRKIGQMLGKEFAVRRLSVPQAALHAYENPAPFSGWGRDPLEELLRAAAPAGGKCEFYLTVTRASTQFADKNQTLTGLGMLDHALGVFGYAYHLYAAFSVRVYDGNFKFLKGELATTDPLLTLQSFMGPGIRAMYRKVDQTWWPEPPQRGSSRGGEHSSANGCVTHN